MFLLFAIAIGLGLLGMLVPLSGKSYSPSWEANGFLNLSWAFALPKSPLQDCWAWVLLNFTQGPFPSLIFRPDNFSYAMVPLTGVPWKNQPTMSHSWFGFISQTKIWIFNVSVPDSYIPVCHSSHKLSINQYSKERTYSTSPPLKGTIIWQPADAVWMTLRTSLLWVPMCLGLVLVIEALSTIWPSSQTSLVKILIVYLLLVIKSILTKNTKVLKKSA
jgi:hypothetical protein